jgi:hypothetical protein
MIWFSRLSRLVVLALLAFADGSAPAAAQNTDSSGGWRLIRSPNPQGGKDAISITHSAELSDSNPDFVGLMIRCGEPDIEVLPILLRTLPPHARPIAVINGTRFEGTVVAPGSAILVPKEATALAKSAWQKLPRLSLIINTGDIAIQGFIRLEGLDAALNRLNAACMAR